MAARVSAAPCGAFRQLHAWVSILVMAGVSSMAGASRALDAGVTAGTLNGEPVELEEIDTALAGAIRRQWREMDEVVRAAARALCVERALERLANRAGSDVLTWKASVWRRTEPDADAIDEFLAADEAKARARPPARSDAKHLVHVRSYRRAIRQAADKLIGDSYQLTLPASTNRPDGEPQLPPVVARCLGTEITPQQVERFASFPLYRRRAEVVVSACRQFEIDYSNPLVLGRIAASKGMSVDALLKSVEGEGSPSAEQVETVARERFGRVDPASLAKTRLVLAAKRRADGRMAFFEKVRRETRGECRLELPGAPVAQLRAGSEKDSNAAAVRVLYFGALSCQLCERGWETLMRLRARWGNGIHVEFRHHFPDQARRPFEEALDAQCSARQERLWDYGKWRFSQAYVGAPLAPRALGLDAAAFETCRRAPRTAVEILDDTEEALRLGFREAIPSWVIGRRPRRGFQGDRVLDQTIETERAAEMGLEASEGESG
jgi:hypothetical protein